VYGIDLKTGKEVWQLVRNGGRLSIPAVGVAGGRQILVFEDEAPISGASLVGVDLGNRKELWRAPLKARSRSGVSVDGGKAFAGDNDGNVVAVDLLTGVTRWSAEAQGEILTPPAIADGRVYVVAHDTSAGRSQLVALDEQSGKGAWPPYSPSVTGSGGSGAAASGGGVVAGFADRAVRKLSADGGAERWEELTPSVFSPVTLPALNTSGVYVADAMAGLYRLNAETGSRVWDYQFNDLVVRSSPVVSGDKVLLGLDDGRLVAVDVRSGRLVWQSQPSDGPVGAIALSREVVISVRGGKRPGLVAFAHDPKGKLMDIPSPTVIDAGALLGNYATALAVLLAVLFVVFRALASRSGGRLMTARGTKGESADGEEGFEEDGR
jgi:outer membrane protein assembly factor BamB